MNENQTTENQSGSNSGGGRGGSTKKWIWAIIVVIVVILIISTSRGDKTGDTIKIGYFTPLTGPVAGSSGETILNGWKLALADRPTVAGKKLEVIYEDDACDPKKAASAAQKLVSVDKVNILVNGVCSGSMLAAVLIAEPAKKILFTAVSTSPKITTAGDYVFRTSGTGATIAEAVYRSTLKSGYKNIAFLIENAEYPIGIRDSYTMLIAAESGQRLVVSETVNPNETDMKSQVTKILQAKPDAVVVVMNSTVTANTFVKTAKNLGLTKLPIYGNEYFAFSDVYTNPDADGMLATLYKYDPQAANFKALIDKYKTTYGKDPSQALYVGLAYDGFNVLADAIEACGGDNPDCIRDHLYKVKDYQGLTGTITIDENGDTARQSMIMRIKDKGLVAAE